MTSLTLSICKSTLENTIADNLEILNQEDQESETYKLASPAIRISTTFCQNALKEIEAELDRRRDA